MQDHGRDYQTPTPGLELYGLQLYSMVVERCKDVTWVGWGLPQVVERQPFWTKLRTVRDETGPSGQHQDGNGTGPGSGIRNSSSGPWLRSSDAGAAEPPAHAIFQGRCFVVNAASAGELCNFCGEGEAQQEDH